MTYTQAFHVRCFFCHADLGWVLPKYDKMDKEEFRKLLNDSFKTVCAFCMEQKIIRT